MLHRLPKMLGEKAETNHWGGSKPTKEPPINGASYIPYR